MAKQNDDTESNLLLEKVPCFNCGYQILCLINIIRPKEDIFTLELFCKNCGRFQCLNLKFNKDSVIKTKPNTDKPLYTG